MRSAGFLGDDVERKMATVNPTPANNTSDSVQCVHDLYVMAMVSSWIRVTSSFPNFFSHCGRRFRTGARMMYSPTMPASPADISSMIGKHSGLTRAWSTSLNLLERVQSHPNIMHTHSVEHDPRISGSILLLDRYPQVQGLYSRLTEMIEPSCHLMAISKFCRFSILNSTTMWCEAYR